MNARAASSTNSEADLWLGSDQAVVDRLFKWHSWHSWKLLGCSAVLVSSTLTTEVSACGATPAEVYPLLPAPGQEEVPLNAVLSVVPSYRELMITMELREKGTTHLVELTMDACPGNVCSATPSALLANTEYEYRAITEYEEENPGEWTSFTTGSNTSEATLDASDVTSTLLSAGPKEVPENVSNCGYTRGAQIEIDLASLTLPIAILEGGSGPDFFQRPLILNDENVGTLGVGFWQGCATPVLIDTLGHRVELDDVCDLEDEGGDGMGGADPVSPKNDDPTNDSESPTPGASSDDELAETRDPQGCSVGTPGAVSGGYALWGILGLGLGRMHRRRARRSMP